MARMPSRRSAGGFTRSQRQPTDWGRSVTTGFVTLPAASKVILATLVLFNPGISETVRRTRGVVVVTSDQEAIVEPQVGALGAIVVTDTALAVGVASLPDPVTDSSDDGWFVWMPILQASGFDVSGVEELASAAMNRYEFDSKAMRRVEDGFSIAFVAANSSATTGMRIALSLSALSSRS